MNLKFASFWRRLIAFIIDHILVLVFTSIVSALFNFEVLQGYCTYLLFFFSYNISFELSNFQGTLGKHWLGIKVISGHGDEMNFKQSLYRNLGKIFSGLPLWYGFLRILAPEQKQTIHDELAKSFVVEKEPVSAY